MLSLLAPRSLVGDAISLHARHLRGSLLGKLGSDLFSHKVPTPGSPARGSGSAFPLGAPSKWVTLRACAFLKRAA